MATDFNSIISEMFVSKGPEVGVFKPSPKPKKPERMFSGSFGMAGSFTHTANENERIKRKGEFWEGVGAAAMAPASFTLGYTSSLLTLGFQDSIFFRMYEQNALKDLEKDVTSLGYKVKSKDDKNQWIVTSPDGKDGLINPSNILQGTFPKDLQGYVAQQHKFDVLPEDQFAYNMGKLFGSIRQLSKIAGKGIGALPLGARLSRAAQVSSTGALYASVEQMRKKIEGKDVSWEEWHRTGGMFAAFGAFESGMSGIANSYKMGKYLKTPEGVKNFGALSKSDSKFFIRAWEQSFKIDKRNFALKNLSDKDLLLSSKIYRNAPVRPVGFKPLDIPLAKKIVSQPVMPKDTWFRIYGPRLEKIAKKLDIQKLPSAQAVKVERLLTAQTRKTVASKTVVKGESESIPDIPPGANVYKTKAGRIVVEKPGDIGTKQGTVLRDGKVYERGAKGKLGEELLPVKAEQTVSAIKDAPKSSQELVASPYANMPIKQVEELSAYGVDGAKQFLEKTKAIVVTPATNAQRDKIVQSAATYGMGEDHIRRLMEDVSQVDEIEKLSKEEAAELIERLDNYAYMDARGASVIEGSNESLVVPGMSDTEMRYIKGISGSNEGWNRTVNYINQYGGFPTDKSLPDLKGQQKKYSEIMRIVAKRQAQLKKKVDRFAGTPNQVNMLGTWQHIGYSLDRFEQLTGTKIRRDWSDAVAETTHWANVNEQEVMDAAKKAGFGPLSRVSSMKANQQILEWMNTADDEVRAEIWNGMNDKTRAATTAANEIYQGSAAADVRWVQYVNWDLATNEAAEMLNKIKATGKDPSAKQIKAARAIIKGSKPYNALDSDLIDGRAAFSMGQGREWLEAATWGTRRRYAPQENDLSSIMGDMPGSSIPQEVFFRQAELGTLSLKTPSAAFARKGKGDVVKSGNVFLDLLNHKNRLTSYASTHGLRIKMWDNLKRANLSTKDEANLRRMMDTLIGIHHPLDDWAKAAKTVDIAFWRNFLVLDPRGSIKFGYRQLFQNSALGPSHFNTAELTKAALRFPHFRAAQKWMKNNPDATLSYKEYFNKHINESRAAQRFMIKKSSEISGLDLVSKAGAFFDYLGFVPRFTDWTNRKAIWPVAYWMAETNIEAFAAGKINDNQLWKRLKLHIIPPSYQLEMQELLQNRDYSLFKSRYAEYKTEAINMRYKPMLRSTQEMTPTGRLIFGPIVFARGVANLAIKNGLEPMLYGNPRRAWEGAKSLLKLAIGGIMANELSDRTTGYNVYDVPRIILGVGPFSPGMGSIAQLFNETSFAVRNAPLGTPPAEIAKEMVKIGSKNLEHFLGIADVAIDYYRVNKDVEYAHLWDLASQIGMSEWEKRNKRKFKPINRSTRDKMLILFLDVEPRSKKSDWEQFQDNLSNRSKKTFRRK